MNMSEVYFAPAEVKQRYYKRCERQRYQLIKILQNPRYDYKSGAFLDDSAPVLGRLRTLEGRMNETRETLGRV